MEKNPTNEKHVVMPSVVPVLFGNIKEFILGKNLMNVRNVEKPLELLQAFTRTWSLTLELDLISVSSVGSVTERVTGKKARGLQREEMGCKCQTVVICHFRGRRKQAVIFFPLLDTNLKRGFPLQFCVAIMTPGSTWTSLFSYFVLTKAFFLWKGLPWAMWMYFAFTRDSVFK